MERWQRTQPDDASGSEDCVEMDSTDPLQEGRWKDSRCLDTLEFVCKRETLCSKQWAYYNGNCYRHLDLIDQSTSTGISFVFSSIIITLMKPHVKFSRN